MKNVLALFHKRSIELGWAIKRKPPGLGPTNQNVVWKNISGGSNPRNL
jgi:hypothetical protein